MIKVLTNAGTLASADKIGLANKIKHTFWMIDRRYRVMRDTTIDHSNGDTLAGQWPCVP